MTRLNRAGNLVPEQLRLATASFAPAVVWHGPVHVELDPAVAASQAVLAEHGVAGLRTMWERCDD